MSFKSKDHTKAVKMPVICGRASFWLPMISFDRQPKLGVLQSNI